MLRECHALKKTEDFRRSPPSARTLFCQPVELGYLQWGTVEEGTIIKLMIDAVLFSCMGALIAGIVAGGAVFISY